MTPQQLTTLKAAILADTAPAVVTARTDRNDPEVARLYNLPAAPDYFIWRDSVTWDEIMQNGFDWVLVDNLAAGKARIWEWLFRNTQTAMNATKANIRAGVAECWKGSAPMNDQRGVVFGHCQKRATKCEKVFATGAGTSTTVDGVGPADGTFFGDISGNDVSAALNLP